MPTKLNELPPEVRSELHCSVMLALRKDACPYTHAVTQRLLDLNDRYAVAKVGSNVAIVDTLADESEEAPIDFLSRANFGLLYENKIEQVTAGSEENPYEKDVKLTNLWLEWKFRRTYDGGIVYAPSGEVPKNKLNLFRGFAVKPQEGCWDLFEAHIR